MLTVSYKATKEIYSSLFQKRPLKTSNQSIKLPMLGAAAVGNAFPLPKLNENTN
ncbi:Chloride channel protein [Bacillus cereus]|nr:Chloride channel protein [Bacillus cereus]